MMNYTRLTKKAENGKPYFDGCLLCDLESDCGLCPYWASGLNRLAELEDKIEQGTLIELPCNVGGKFYQVVKGLPIYEWEVETIVFSNIYFPQNYVITARRTKDLAFWKFWSEDFGETIFLTRDEAEKRLEELQNGNND